eukprot:361880-Chlamydomonas_euryale.AAC.10
MWCSRIKWVCDCVVSQHEPLLRWVGAHPPQEGGGCCGPKGSKIVCLSRGPRDNYFKKTACVQTALCVSSLACLCAALALSCLLAWRGLPVYIALTGYGMQLQGRCSRQAHLPRSDTHSVHTYM